MNWDKKTQLVKLGNNANDKESRKAFLDYVITNIDDFDEQDWDMFFTSIELIQSNIDEHTEIHKVIQDKVQEMQSDSFRTAMRMALYEELVKCSLYLKK